MHSQFVFLNLFCNFEPVVQLDVTMEGNTDWSSFVCDAWSMQKHNHVNYAVKYIHVQQQPLTQPPPYLYLRVQKFEGETSPEHINANSM